jgi:hypothetical protein
VSPLTAVAAVLALTTALATVVVLACLYHGRDRSITAAQDALDEDEPPTPTPYRRVSDRVHGPAWYAHQARTLEWLTADLRNGTDLASKSLAAGIDAFADMTPEPSRKDLAR